MREAAKQQRAVAAAAEEQRADEIRRRREQLNDMPTGIRVEDYICRSTYCPVCAHDFGTNVIPPHGKQPHQCRGSGRLGSTLRSIHQARHEEDKSRRPQGSGSVRALGGGLPGQGRMS